MPKRQAAAENIALDEDGGYAILTRRFLTDHEWLKQPAVVKVFTKTNDATGEVVMAGDAISKTDPESSTTITVLYKMLQDLGQDLDAKLTKAPWMAIYSTDQGRMLTGSTFNDLLDQFLLAHVAPSTAQYI